MEKEVFIFDLETFPNYFLAVFKSVSNKKLYYFEISDRLNQNKELYEFLHFRCKGLIGFNNLNFDYPVLHNTVLISTKHTAQSIYENVKTIINNKYSSIWESDTIIPQLDLYRVWHYNNKNKSTSLKWLEFAMRLPNVEDLPYAVGTELTFEQMDHIKEYCVNDIEATYKFYLKSLKHIELRKFYTNHESLSLMNDSEIGMSKKIFGKYLSKEMGISIKELNQLRTYRKKINIKDIIFNYIKFNDEINKSTLNKFNESVWEYNIDEEKALNSIKFSVPYKNVVREYAEGGLHSFGKPGIYESNDEYVLCDVDFASYYPHISFRNKLHPRHIPEPIFNRIYEGFYTDRKLYSKKDPRNYVLKIILNGSYGLSKDKYAYLYDPKWQLAICINGQLMLTLLTEKIFELCKFEPQIIFENTDGAMYRIKRSDLDNLNNACKIVEEIVNIPLETQICEKIIARDVNNYINIIDKNNIKFKGVFEIDRDYHKNHSKRIVPLALANYYINNINVENTINNHIKECDNSTSIVKEWDYDNNQPIYYNNYGIYDFCLGAKMKGSNELISREILSNTIIENKCSKMTRYYVSNTGVELIKVLPALEKNYLTETDKFKIKTGTNQLNIFDFIEDDITIDPSDREENLESGYKCTIFNKFEQKNNYNINYDYYINECNKIIKQLNNE